MVHYTCICICIPIMYAVCISKLTATATLQMPHASPVQLSKCQTPKYNFLSIFTFSSTFRRLLSTKVHYLYVYYLQPEVLA
jgi:uncharacterized membrane protein YcfT